MPADEHEYQQQLDELRDAASRAMGHTHEVIDSLGLGSGLDRYRTIIETRGGTFQTRAGQAHWQLEAVIPFTGVLQTMEW